jgi:hypothetical protein
MVAVGGTSRRSPHYWVLPHRLPGAALCLAVLMCLKELAAPQRLSDASEELVRMKLPALQE